jgi:CRP-like cAMP-binding protein
MVRAARFVSPMERLLYLRSLPNMASLPSSEYAYIAERARERFERAGSVILALGEECDGIVFVVEGALGVYRADGIRQQTVESPFGAGFLPLFAGGPSATEIRADTDALMLEVSAADILDAVEDNFALMRGVIAAFARQMAALQEELEIAGRLTRSPPKPSEAPPPLDMIARLAIVGRGGPMASAPLDVLAEVAAHSTDVRLPEGTVLFREGDPSTFGFHLLHGVVECESAKRRFTMGPHSVIGFVEAYGAAPRSYTATTATPVAGIRSDVEHLLDVMEDNADLGFALLSFLARSLTDLYGKRVAPGA